MEYFLRHLDEEMWKRVRIKALENDLTAGEVIRRLLQMWIDGKVEIKPDKKTVRKQ